MLEYIINMFFYMYHFYFYICASSYYARKLFEYERHHQLKQSASADPADFPALFKNLFQLYMWRGLIQCLN